MNLELYFLRSSEQKIVNDMLYYAQRVDESDKTVSDFSHLSIYNEFYGLTPKDLGLYAMVDAEVAGAVWSRRLSDYHHSNAFVDNDTPVLNIAVKPKFRNQGVATAMMKQFLEEASTLYKSVSVSVVNQQRKIDFFKKFGFETLPNSSHFHYVSQEESLIMMKKLQKKEPQFKGDDFASCKWLD